MAAPSQVLTRLNAALAAVTTTTNLDTLIALIDSGIRANLNISTAAAELARRAGLVDGNTSEIEAAKIAAAYFKIDNPVTDLWTGSASVSGGIEVGQLVSGFFANNPKYVPAASGRYLVAAYPDMAALVNARSIDSCLEPTSTELAIFTGRLENSVTWREQYLYHDDDLIFATTHPETAGRNGVINVSTDSGVTWTQSILRGWFSPLWSPNAAQGGFTSVSGAWCAGIVKLDSPGHYAALLIPSGIAASTDAYLVKTTDYGKEWFGYLPIGHGSTSSSQPLDWKIFYRNGTFVVVGPSAARYSTDQGVTWRQFSHSSWTSSITNLCRRLTLSEDGYLAWSNSSTTLSYLQWPATTTGWSDTIAFTDRASAFPNAIQYVKKVGTKWFAYHPSATYYYVADSLTGAFTGSSLAGSITGITDFALHDGFYYFIATTSTGPNIGHLTVSGTNSTSFQGWLSNTLGSPWTNSIAINRWPLLSAFFGIKLGTQTALLFRHGRDAIGRINAPSGTNAMTALVSDIPTQGFQHFCRKYGMWFATIQLSNAAVPSAFNNLIDTAGRCLHVRSVDGKTWIGIGVGCSGIVDAGNRLLRINAVGGIEQSTEGTTWVATTTPGSPAGASGWARIWRVKDRIYFYQSAAAGLGSLDSIHVLFENGVNWQIVSGFPSQFGLARLKSNIVFWRGSYYALCPYSSASVNNFSDASVDMVAILRSTDGISFTQIQSASLSSFNVQRAGIFLLNGQVNFMPGAMSGNAQQFTYAIQDGRSIAPSTSSTATTMWGSAEAHDFDQSNGDQRMCIDRSYSYGNTTMRALDIVKEGVVESTVLFFSSDLTRPSAIGGTNGEYMLATRNRNQIFTPAGLAFISPIPNAGTSPMALPFLRVAK